MIDIRALVESAGGVVDGRCVRCPGVKIIARTEVSASVELEEVFNMQDNLKLEEFNGKITYLSDSVSEDYVDGILELGHNISHGNYVSILIAGVKESTVLELVSNGHFKCSRQTTSRTKSACDTLYVVDNELQEEYVDKFLTLRDAYIRDAEYLGLDLELVNEYNLEMKAQSLIVHSELIYLYNYCNKKINNPYEYELQRVCKLILKEIENEALIERLMTLD